MDMRSRCRGMKSAAVLHEVNEVNEAISVVIAERGWVYVGRVSRSGDLLVIKDCHNIRRWGTTKGLGELALEGPKQETLLDFYGTVKIHILAVCGEVSCDEEIWGRWYSDRQTTTKKRGSK